MPKPKLRLLRTSKPITQDTQAMAAILLFPTRHVRDAAEQGYHTLAYCNEALAAFGLDEGLELDGDDRPSLARVAGLAATPSQTISGLTEKVEVLVARLVDDEAGAGLCRAEARLLTSVLQDLRAFAATPVIQALSPVLEEPGGVIR